MSTPLRLGFLGTGQWALHVARTVSGIRDFEIVGCYSLDEKERAAFAESVTCVACSSVEQLLRTMRLDAVCVMTPNDTHHDQALAAMARGLHVFVEKPMAMTNVETASMIDAARKANVQLVVGHNTRRGARFRQMKQKIADGQIGRPLVAHVSFTSSAGLGHQLGSWRYDPKRTRAVALAQIGIHAIDLLNYFFGRPTRVSADILSSGAAGAIEDLCIARINYPDGVIATFNNAYSVARDRSLSILGTGGALITPHEKSLIQRNVAGVEELFVTEDNDTVREEFEEFAAVCRSERLPETGGAEGALAMAVMEAMIESSKLRQEIEL